MNNDTPTMADAAAAIIAEDGPDSPALDLLSQIGRSMARDAEHRQDLLDSYAAKDNGRRLYLEHGVAAALGNSEWGGTTRQYEDTLATIQQVLDTARWGDPHHNSGLKFYVSQCAEQPGGMAPLDPDVWHGFQDRNREEWA